jgi:hypothetical protein
LLFRSKSARWDIARASQKPRVLICIKQKLDDIFSMMDRGSIGRRITLMIARIDETLDLKKCAADA